MRPTVKSLFAALALVLATGAAALAGGRTVPVDSPVTPPPPPAPAVYDWTGGWAGLVLGFGDAASRHCDGPGCTGGAPTFPQVSSSGGLAGVALGYNWQSGSMVYGVVFDYVAARLTGETGSTATYGCGGGCFTDITGIATLRGRLGWAMDRSMVFVSGGMAQVRGEGGLIAVGAGDFSFTTPVIGLGFETAVGARMTLSGEVLHTLPQGPYIVVPGACAAPGCQVDRISTTTARLNLNFRF